jgi:hypothetical protein
MSPGQIVVLAASVGAVGFIAGLTFQLKARLRLGRQVNSLLWQLAMRDQALSAATGERPDRIQQLVDDVRRDTRDQQMLRRDRREERDR